MRPSGYVKHLAGMGKSAGTLGRANLKNVTKKTVGEVEAEISQAFIRFEKDVMGRGPLETKTYILDDLVLIRLKGVLTPTEIKLAETADRERGRYLVKQTRQQLLEHGRPVLEAMIREILGVEIRCLHTDISTKTGERIVVLSLESKPACAERRGQALPGLGRSMTRNSEAV